MKCLSASRLYGRISGAVLLAMFAGVVSASAAPALLPDVSQSDAISFVPHRAVYDFSLVDTGAGSSVSGMTGRMVYEINGSACEGYTQNMRFVTMMTNEEGSQTINDMRNSSFEDIKRGKLRFSFKQLQDDKIIESSQGDAARKGDKQVVVDVTKPKKKRVILPGEVYFPIQHARALITAAKRGDKFFKGYLFDGSEKGEKYYLTNAVIGKKLGGGATPLPASFKEADRMAATPSWPVAISYFDVGKDHEDSTPAYEIKFRYFENGVTADLGIDYGSFAIHGDLKELTFLEASKCADAE